MGALLNIYKPIGLTPLQIVQAVKKEYSELKHEKIGYAGRLDPIACGVLLLMVGDETKKRDTYQNLPKSYEFTVLFGTKTDSYDILGLVTSISKIPSSLDLLIRSFAKSYAGKQMQTYPPYSSIHVNGKPLFWWAKHGLVSEVTIPQKEIEIYSFEVLETVTISQSVLKKEIMEKTKLVQGDFRQSEIIQEWKRFFVKNNPRLSTATFRISCSSGTYIRSIIHTLGQTIGCGAISLGIKRTQVGRFFLNDSVCLKKYY